MASESDVRHLMMPDRREAIDRAAGFLHHVVWGYDESVPVPENTRRLVHSVVNAFHATGYEVVGSLSDQWPSADAGLPIAAPLGPESSPHNDSAEPGCCETPSTCEIQGGCPYGRHNFPDA
jgi:hypothetical protein